MTHLPFPLEGSTLLVGPSGVGKTQRTAAALDAWVAERGADGVAVLEFGPAYRRDDRLLGGRLTRFTNVPGEVWFGRIEAHAPRAEAAANSDLDATNLAAENAARAEELFDALPTEPKAVFVNDATIPFQDESASVGRLTAYCDQAECAVLNAFDSDELGTDDPVSRQERAVLESLRTWVDRVIPLE